MIDDGELNSTEAEGRFKRAFRKVAFRSGRGEPIDSQSQADGVETSEKSSGTS
jgi:hypothetical protein